MTTCTYCGGDYHTPVELHHDETECTLRRAGSWVSPPETLDQALIGYGALTALLASKQLEVERLQGELAAAKGGE